MKIFHHDDLDGKSGAFICNYFTVDSTNPDIFVMLTHDKEKDKQKLEMVEENERVIIVDYSFGENTIDNLRNILKKTTDVTWIDHHKTSIDLIKNHPEFNKIRGYRVEGYSGVALAYMYYTQFIYNNSDEDWETRFKQLPYWIQLISDYDCWKKQDKNSDFFKLGMDTIEHEPLCPIWYDLIKIKSTVATDMILNIVFKGEIIKSYIDNNYKYIRESIGYESELDGIKTFVVNMEGNSWIFGDLINKYPMCALFTFDGEKYVYSIYSDGKQIDCSKVAARYGGGGHPGASGFSSTELLLKKNYPSVSNEAMSESYKNYLNSIGTKHSDIFTF